MIKQKRGMAGWIWILIILILIGAGIGIYFWLIGNNSNSFDTTNFTTWTCEKDGFCAYPEGKKIVKCTDTDGGDNIYLRGKIALYDENGTYYAMQSLVTSLKQYDSSINPYEDFCINKNELEEYTCNPRDIEDKFNCPNGCKNGACIQ